MSPSVKKLILKKICNIINAGVIDGRKVKVSGILSSLRMCQNSESAFEYEFNIGNILKENSLTNDKEPRMHFSVDSGIFCSNFSTDEVVNGIYVPHLENSRKSLVRLKVCQNTLMKETLNTVCSYPNKFWLFSPLIEEIKKQNVIVEFSSPNIAKPFHMGNLKSTIIGNFLSRLLEAVGHKVVKLNYLGDWGTQFGLLKYGYDSQKINKEHLESEALKKLCNLYVWANKEAEKDPEILKKAKNIFNSMESGNEEVLKDWRLFRDISIKELKQVYNKFNIVFDEYHGESMYKREYCNNILNLMSEKLLLKRDSDGRMMYKSHDGKSDITLIKSDGSTLYLTRDIAAAVHRYDKYQFDKMFYVVDSSQDAHFKNLIHILRNLNYHFAEHISHIGFGRIEGMSTRKGTIVTLEDILKEGVQFFLKKQLEDKDTPTDESFNRIDTAEKLVVSAIIIAGIKYRRRRNVQFKWEEVLQNKKGDKLHYVHCRLLRLEENCGVEYSPDVDVDLLTEPEAINLVGCIARFDEVLLSTYDSMEPSYLYIYLQQLCAASTSAYKKLPVKNSSTDVARARLKLFRASRHTLYSGMNILGIEPLERM